MEDDDSEAFQFLLTLLQVMPVLLLAYAVEFGVAAKAAARSLNASERLRLLPRLAFASIYLLGAVVFQIVRDI